MGYKNAENAVIWVYVIWIGELILADGVYYDLNHHYFFS